MVDITLVEGEPSIIGLGKYPYAMNEQIHELYRLENNFRAGGSYWWRIAIADIADIFCDGSMPPREEARTQLHRLGENSIQASLEELNRCTNCIL